MYTLILIFVTLGILYGLAEVFEIKQIKFGDGRNYQNIKMFYIVLMVIGLISTISINFISITNQHSDYLNLTMVQEQKAVYQEKADSLTIKFKNALMDKYPVYEKDIFDNMTPEDLKMLFVKYPDIKASLTTINYVDKIDVLISKIYEQDILSKEIIRDIRFRFINPWIFNFLTPELPDNLIKVYYSKN